MIFKIHTLFYRKSQIFLGSVHIFGRSDDDLIYYLKKLWFPLDAYVVSWPACTKNLELTLLGLSAYRVAIFGLTGCCISWCPPSLFIHKNISFSEMECLWWWYVRCFLFLFQTVFKTLTFLFNVKQMKIYCLTLLNVDATIITDLRSHFSTSVFEQILVSFYRED